MKKKEIHRDGNDKQVRTNIVVPLKKKEFLRYEMGKLVLTYADVVSTGNLSNEKEK